MACKVDADFDGRKAGHVAAKHEHWDIVEYLVDSGYRVTSTDVSGHTLSYLAALGCQWDLLLVSQALMYCRLIRTDVTGVWGSAGRPTRRCFTSKSSK